MSVLTQDDKEQIHLLHQQGLGCTRIARAIKRHASTVRWFMYQDGIAPPKQTDTPSSYLRNGKRVHRFTRAEDEFIERRRREGLSFPQIAAAASAVYGTDRTPHVIQCRLIMLAGIEP